MSKKRPISISSSPSDFNELQALIVEHHDFLPGRLQQIAKYALDNPEQVAFDSITDIAKYSKTHASTVVRFAQTFGLSGASELQRIFRAEVLNNGAPLSYQQRLRKSPEDPEGKSPQTDRLLDEFINGSKLTLQKLQQSVDRSALQQVVRAIIDAEVVYVAGFKRSFPVVSYLFYSLHQVSKPVYMIEGVAGMRSLETSLVGPEDALIIVSFHPYADEAVDVAKQAHDQKARIIAITDSLVSPISALAKLSLVVQELEVRGFRSLTASLCLAQAIVIESALKDQEGH